ncbi:hypothetical protein [Nocardia niwae]|uniref:hypothetical protein n=1 Tax=Nocardia niwae TaxID=626084 RepID=UPI0033E65B7D
MTVIGSGPKQRGQIAMDAAYEVFSPELDPRPSMRSAIQPAPEQDPIFARPVVFGAGGDHNGPGARWKAIEPSFTGEVIASRVLRPAAPACSEKHW